MYQYQRKFNCQCIRNNLLATKYNLLLWGTCLLMLDNQIFMRTKFRSYSELVEMVVYDQDPLKKDKTQQL